MSRILHTITIFVILVSLLPISLAQNPEIPSWIKNTAGFWANDHISDAEFLNAIQYLFDKEILKSNNQIRTVIIPLYDIPNITNIEIPVTEKTKEQVIDTDLDLLAFKVIRMQDLAAHFQIVDEVIESNKAFAAMPDPYAFIDEQDEEWTNHPDDKNSPFMYALTENKIAKILKNNAQPIIKEFADVTFSEIIITNEYGAKVASNIRTEDYKQSDELWWIDAKDKSLQVLHMPSDDGVSVAIVIPIVDGDGQFIGVLKAITPLI